MTGTNGSSNGRHAPSAAPGAPASEAAPAATAASDVKITMPARLEAKDFPLVVVDHFPRAYFSNGLIKIEGALRTSSDPNDPSVTAVVLMFPPGAVHNLHDLTGQLIKGQQEQATARQSQGAPADAPGTEPRSGPRSRQPAAQA